MARTHLEFPERLVHADNSSATLIQRALAEPALGPSEQRSWQRLQERSRLPSARWVWPVLAFAAAAAALLLWRQPNQDPALRPEVLLPRPSPVAPAAPLDSTLHSPEPAPVPRVERPKGSASGAASADTDTTACAKLAQAADYEAAAACYGRLARGTSMASELALYEKARLESKALGRSAQALTTLDEHARRFAGGVLATEVGLTRIELLSQLGRRTEALSAIEQGLQGPLGRERGADLLVMRAELLTTQGDCGAALEAAQKARDAGVHPSRLETVERRCSAATPAPAAVPSSTGGP